MSSTLSSSLCERLEKVRARIAAAAKTAGRDPSAITLIAVSKGHAAQAIEEAIGAGQRDFGENRVQEAQEKFTALRARHPAIRLHLIGSLQTNKLEMALALAQAIHTLDRPKLADKLLEARARGHALPPLFIQVNTGEEPQKGGVMPAEADRFIADCLARELPVIGLMCIPPLDEEPALHFALLAKLAARHGLKALSMGMSEDYETAIAFGATHVRIGSAVFGPRTP